MKTSKNLLRKIDVFQNSALRICLGAMRSTPIQPIHVKASEPPLEIRRNLLSEKWVLKAHSTNFELFSYICHLNESDLTHKYWIKKPSPPLCTALQNNPIFSKKLNTVDRKLDYFALFHKTDVIIPTYNEYNIISNNILKSILNCYSDATVIQRESVIWNKFNISNINCFFEKCSYPSISISNCPF